MITCNIEENRKTIVNQSKIVAKSIAQKNNVATEITLANKVLEVNFRPVNKDITATYSAASSFLERFKNAFVGTNATKKKRYDGSNYVIVNLDDNTILKLANAPTIKKEIKYYQLNDKGINPLLESSIEKSLQPELVSTYLTPNTFLDKLSSFGFTKEEILYLTEPLVKNPSLWVEAPNVNTLISYRIAEQMKFSQSKIAKEANEELDYTIKDFLKGLNISINEYDDLKSKIGVDALGMANILEKSIDLAKNRKIDTLPEEAAHFYVELLAKRNTKDNLTEYNLYQDLMSKIESWEKFEDIKKAYMPKYNDLEMVKKEAVAKAIAEAIVDRFESSNDPIKKAITDLLEWLKSLFKTSKNFNVKLLADDVAKKMLSRDYSDISRSLEDSSNLTDYKDVDKDTLDLISKFGKIGAYLSGSIALRKQGSIYRIPGEIFHDLDFQVPIENKEQFLKDLKKAFPEIELSSEFDSEYSYTTLWKLNYNGKEYDIDFFFSKEKFPVTKDNMVHWQDIFKAKLEMGREKDVRDFINFIPFQEPVQEQKRKFFKFFQLEKPTEVKPGVSELFESNPQLASQVYEALGFKQELPSIDNIIETGNKKETKEKLNIRRERVLREINTIEELILNNPDEITIYYVGLYEYDPQPFRYFNKINWEQSTEKYKTSSVIKKPSYLHSHLEEELQKRIKNLQVINSRLYSDVESVNYSNIFQTGKSYSSLDVLKYIANNKKDVLSGIAEKLLKYSEKNNIEVSILEKGETSNVAGLYLGSKNKIEIYGKKSVTSHTLIHEIVHSLSVIDIFLNPNSKQVKSLEKILKNILDKKILKEYENFESSYEDYATKNIKELLSEILSRPDILAHLALYDTNYNLITSKYKKETLLDEIIKILSDIFNFSKREAETLADAILLNAVEIFENSRTTSNYKTSIVTPQQKQQAQQLYSQYLESLNKPNTNPILQGNQKEQVKKFAELQERLNNKEFLEGAKNAYESTPELQQFGTQEQYNDYIARVSLGIIKNPSSGEYNYTSEVKDIVYHGSPVKDILSFEKGNKELIKKYKEDLDKYKPLFKHSINDILKKYGINIKDLDSLKLLLSKANWEGSRSDFLEKHELGLASTIYDLEEKLKQVTENQGIFFTDDFNYANSDFFTKEGGKVYSVLIDVKNPKYEDNVHTMRIKKTGNDSIIGKEYLPIDGYTDVNSYVVFEPEQIHILGGKEDIEGFKEFVEGKPAEKKLTKEEKVNKEVDDYLATETTEDVAEEKAVPSPETREKTIADIVQKMKNLLTRLGINLKEFEDIYIEQQKINELTNKLNDPKTTESEKVQIQNQIAELKAKGIDQRAIAVADMLNRTINISVNGDVQDLSEEVIHFIVDIIQQKYPDLYKELYDKVWSYEKYKQVKEDYKDRYTTEEEFRKEAIAQVLNDYLLNPTEAEAESDYQNQKTENFWDKIVNSLKNLFTKTANVNIDSFKIAADKLLNSDFITEDDIKYLNSKGLFYSLKKGKTGQEVKDSLIKASKQIEIKQNKEGKPRYFRGGTEVLKRVSDVVSAYYGTIFRNNDKKDTAINEQVREEGVEIHSIFQHTFAKYVSEDGEVLTTPKAANSELKELTDKYPNIASKVDEVVKQIIKVNPDSYFLTELKVSDGTKIGGTLDLVVIRKKDGRTSVYDWKTKRGRKQEKGTRNWVERTQIDWWNVNGWRIQLGEYTKILRKNGVTNFGEVRMIPVMTFEKKVGNEWKIDKIDITPFERSLVDPKKRQLLPVISEEERSAYETINKITQKIRAVINQNLQKIKADYKLKPDLEEENAVLENIYTILLATDNVESALLSLKIIIEDAKDLANKAATDRSKINELTDAELYNYYRDIQLVRAKLGIYKEADGNISIINLAQEIFGKNITKIKKEYEEALKESRDNPSQENTERVNKLKPGYQIASSLSEINTAFEEVSGSLNDYSKAYFEAYSERNGVKDIFDNDLGQSFLGKFMNNVRGLYSLNFKTAQLAKKLLLKANAIVRDKNKQVTDSMYALRDKFTKGKYVSDVEDLFKNLIYYDEDKNDYFLVPEVSKEYAIEFKKIKDEFERGYNSKGSEFFNTKEYKEIKRWLEDNLEMTKWEEDFKKKKEAILKKFEESNRATKQSDPIEYARLYAIKENQIEYFNNILTSPKALESLKKFRYANKAKWTSAEYKKLTAEEKEVHKKFTSIYARAEKIGYVQGFKNYYRIPFKIRESKNILQSLDPRKAFTAVKEDEVYKSFTRVDPVTGEEIYEVPIHMTDYLPAKEKGKRIKSLDLFQVYLEFEQNLNRFEEMNKIEDMMLDILRIEENKITEKEVNIFGKLTGKQPKKESAGLMSITREDALKKLVFNSMYKIKYEKDVLIPFTKVNLKNVFKDRKYLSVKKTFQWLNDYSTLLFVQASLKISGGAAIASSIVAATGTSKNIQGSRYLKSALQRITPLWYILRKVNPNSINPAYRKSFNYEITQKEVEELNLNRTETVKRYLLYGKEYLVNHLKHIDTFVQSAVFDASLENFLVINNKIVNADTYFASVIKDADTLSYTELKKKEKELYEKHKNDTLANYLKNNTKDNKTDISKLDKQSVHDFENTIRLESKKIVGNMSEEDMFAMRTGFFGAIFTKFKSWMPELYNSFFGGIYWREEGKRFEAGRFTSFYKAVVNTIDETDASGDEKSMIKMGMEYILKNLLFLYNVGAFTVGKEENAIKRLETRYNNYVEELEEMGIDNIPTKKEYIDLTLQEARNARNFVSSVFVLILLSGVLSVLSGDDDPDDHPYLVRIFEILGMSLEPADDEIARILFQLANSFTAKGMMELDSYYSPEQGYETFSKLTFPALGATAVLGKGIKEASKLLIPGTDAELKYTLEAIPIVRPALKSYIKYTDDEELEELLNVDKQFRLRKKEEDKEEVWF